MDQFRFDDVGENGRASIYVVPLQENLIQE